MIVKNGKIHCNKPVESVLLAISRIWLITWNCILLLSFVLLSQSTLALFLACFFREEPANPLQSLASTLVREIPCLEGQNPRSPQRPIGRMATEERQFSAINEALSCFQEMKTNWLCKGVFLSKDYWRCKAVSYVFASENKAAGFQYRSTSAMVLTFMVWAGGGGSISMWGDTKGGTWPLGKPTFM